MVIHDKESAKAPRILVLASGEFGAAVSARLATHRVVEVLDIDKNVLHPAVLPYGELIIFITAEEKNDLVEMIDRTAFQREIPWFPIVTNSLEVRCGPVVIPQRTACYSCYQRRVKQHSKAKSITRVSNYLPPSGFAAHHVGIATAFALQALNDIAAAESTHHRGATIRSLNDITGLTSRSEVISANGCPRCSGRLRKEDLEEVFLRQIEQLPMGVAVQTKTECCQARGL